MVTSTSRAVAAIHVVLYSAKLSLVARAQLIVATSFPCEARSSRYTWAGRRRRVMTLPLSVETRDGLSYSTATAMGREESACVGSDIALHKVTNHELVLTTFPVEQWRVRLRALASDTKYEVVV